MNHTWRHKSTHQQICARCGQVRRWNGTRWLYRKQGQLVRQRPTCGEKRTDTDRYAELRALVEAWQQWQRDPHYNQVDACERLIDWSHR